MSVLLIVKRFVSIRRECINYSGNMYVFLLKGGEIC